MLASALAAQELLRFGRVLPHVVDVELASHGTPAPSAAASAARLVDERVLRMPGYAWMQVEFARVELAAGDTLELRSLRDGAVEVWDHSVRRRRFSAFFTGDAVRVRLWRASTRGRSAYRIVSLAGAKSSKLVGPQTLCGNDDRIPSGDRRCARLLLRFANGFSWCSAFLISPNGDGRALDCLVTSGTCLGLPGVQSITAEFQVPSSRADGTILHPTPSAQYLISARRQFSATGVAGSDWGLIAALKNTSTGLYPGQAQFAGFNMATGAVPAQLELVSFGTSTAQLTRNGTQQGARGDVRASSANSVLHRGDSTGGSAGGPLLDAAGRVVALQVAGGCDASATSTNGATRMSAPAFAAARQAFCTQLPDLAVTALSATATTWQARQLVGLRATVSNVGPGTATSVDCGFYLSDDTVISNADRLLASFRIASLAKDQKLDYRGDYRVPDSLLPGTRWLGVFADDGEAVLEWDETNNTRSLAVQCRALPNLFVRSLASTPSLLVAKQGVQVIAQVANGGGVDVGPSVAALVLSEDGTITRTDRLLARIAVPAVVAGRSVAVNSSFTTPSDVASGACWLGLIVDRDDAFVEIDERDNSFALARQCQGLPDLVASDISTSVRELRPTIRFPLECKIDNAGAAASPVSDVRYVLSQDSFVSSDDRLLGVQSLPSIATKATQVLRFTAVAPSTLQAGTCFLGVAVDPSSKFVEQTRSNNTRTAPVTCNARAPRANLRPTQSALSSSALVAGASVRVDSVVQNLGLVASTPTRVGIYLSDDRAITAADTLLQVVNLSALAVQGQQRIAQATRLPITLKSGDCWVGVYADDQNLVPEENETDNVEVLAARCTGLPDLRVRVTSDIVNLGGAASTGVELGFYLSRDSVIDGSDTLLLVQNFAALAATGVRVVQVDVVMPVDIAPGPCWLGSFVDRSAVLPEVDETNNTGSVAGSCVALPDLVCETLSVLDARVETGKPVAVRIGVRNRGGASAAASDLPIVFSGVNPQLDQPLLGTAAVPALGAGRLFEVTLQFVVPHTRVPGAQRLSAFVDPLRLIQEADEQNNLRQADINVQLATGNRRSVEWVARYPDVARDVATLSLAKRLGADIDLHLPGDRGRLYILLWSGNPTIFSFDGLSSFSLGLLNGPAFLSFAGLTDVRGRARAGFRLPDLRNRSLDVYTYCFVFDGAFQFQGFANDVLKTQVRP